jgi:hypothetical protein
VEEHLYSHSHSDPIHPLRVLAACVELKGSTRRRSEEERLNWGFYYAEDALVAVVGGDGGEVGTLWLL